MAESAFPKMLVVTGDETSGGCNSELFTFIEPPPSSVPFPSDGTFSAELNAAVRAPPKLADVTSDDVGVATGASNREGAIVFDRVGVEDSAGNFAIKLAVPELLTANAGNAAGAFIPNSSALALEIASLENALQLNNPQNNRFKKRFITLAPNMRNRRLKYRWLSLVGSPPQFLGNFGDGSMRDAGRKCASNGGGRMGALPPHHCR